MYECMPAIPYDLPQKSFRSTSLIGPVSKGIQSTSNSSPLMPSFVHTLANRFPPSSFPSTLLYPSVRRAPLGSKIETTKKLTKGASGYVSASGETAGAGQGQVQARLATSRLTAYRCSGSS